MASQSTDAGAAIVSGFGGQALHDPRSPGPPAPQAAPVQHAAEATASTKSYVTLSGPPSGYAALLTDPDLHNAAASTAPPLRDTQGRRYSSDADAIAPLPVSSPAHTSADANEHGSEACPSLAVALRSAEDAVQQAEASASTPTAQPLASDTSAIEQAEGAATPAAGSPHAPGSQAADPQATDPQAASVATLNPDSGRARGRGLFGLLGRRRGNTDVSDAPQSGAGTPVPGNIAAPLLQFAKDIAAGKACADASSDAAFTAADVAQELLRLEALHSQEAAQRDAMARQLEHLQVESQQRADELRTARQDAQTADEHRESASAHLSALHLMFVQALQDVVMLRTQAAQSRCERVFCKSAQHYASAHGCLAYARAQSDAVAS